MKINDLFNRIKNGKAVRVALAVLDSNEKERYNCVLNTLELPSFSLTFPTGALPVERIDRNRSCVVLIDLAGQSISLTATITTIPNRQTMLLTGQEVVDHEQLRDFFRVDVVTPVKATPLPLTNGDDNSCCLTGETVDFSGNGLLACFNTSMETDSLFQLEVKLPPHGLDVAQMIGRVIRSIAVKDNRYQVAFYFEEIAPETRDKIMACCFKIQRNHLRMRVRVRQ
ncbi:MAG: hypothetical protein CSA34_01225 [Desulfobulbus propionicus]|nr:MAG: hypothetical protein CSA34_01225 [Desulfobulbus propionicus]